MKKYTRHYSWWRYIKEIVQQYPNRKDEDLESVGVSFLESVSVRSAIAATEQMENGAERMRIIKMVHWDRTHTLEGAALEIPCDRATAARWQRKFFEEVARNRGLLD